MSLSASALAAAHALLPVGTIAIDVETGRSELNLCASKLLGPAPSPHALPFDDLFGAGALGHVRHAPAAAPCLLRAFHPEASHPIVDVRAGPRGPVMACTVVAWPPGAPVDPPSEERLAHVVSHDLREPHRMIDAFLELLLREIEGPLTPRGERDLQFIRDATHRLGAQLEALTIYARLDTRAKTFDAVDLRAVVEKATRQLPSDAELDIDRPAEPVIALGDPTQLTLGLYALLDNAFKFSHKGEARVRLAINQHHGSVVVSITDQGIGIPDGDHERMFRMFQQRHPRGDYPGLGMGLPLARRVAQRHGGACWLDAPPEGRGTVAHLSLQPAFEHVG